MSAESCPFTFNFDPATFSVGDCVSYRVAALGDMPFVGTLVEVHEDHVVLHDASDPDTLMRASRTSRPSAVMAD